MIKDFSAHLTTVQHVDNIAVDCDDDDDNDDTMDKSTFYESLCRKNVPCNQNIFCYPNPIHRGDQCPHLSELARVPIIVDLQGGQSRARQGDRSVLGFMFHSQAPQCTVCMHSSVHSAQPGSYSEQ